VFGNVERAATYEPPPAGRGGTDVTAIVGYVHGNFCPGS